MKIIWVIGIILVVAIVGFFVFENPIQKSSSQGSSIETKAIGQGSSSTANFTDPKKAAHYESNTPAHGSVLAGVPVNVVIDFNFDLAQPSEIKIFKDGKDFGQGETVLDSNKLAMRRNINYDSPNGLFTVEYKACWPDKSCHDGSFQFVIDRSAGSVFEDRTGSKEVTVRMSQIAFNPQNLKVSKGTKVTWINDDSVEHYVNTETHPAHTYYPQQNSKALKKGEIFSLVFDKAGIYPYHCSAHASTMTGSLLVE
ncbi:cupredoxin domain-containing protein [Candidatus Curtissbacteria bacterium]|nr:cupredoxin domain-containing protein [Candidatus Curtissbacteria bacterium]